MHITQMVNEIATSRPLGHVKGQSQSFSDLLINKASSSAEGRNTLFLPLETNTEEGDNDVETSVPNDEQANDPVLSGVPAENQANPNQMPIGVVDFGQPSVVNEEGGSKPAPVDSTGWDLGKTTTGVSDAALTGATSSAETGEPLEKLAKEPEEKDNASGKPTLSQEEHKDIAVDRKTSDKEPSPRQVASPPLQDIETEPTKGDNRAFRDKNQQMSPNRSAPLPQGDDKIEPENRAESLRQEQKVAPLTKEQATPSEAMKASKNDAAAQVVSNSSVQDESPVRTEAERAPVFKNEPNKLADHEENGVHTGRNEATTLPDPQAEGEFVQTDSNKRIVHEKEPSTAPRIIEGPNKQTPNGTGMASGQMGIEGSVTVEATKLPSGKSALPPMLTKQLERVLRAAVLKQHGDGALQLTVKLHPETLGRLHVQLLHSSQGLVVKLLADKKATAETLERALPGLRQLFNQDTTFEIGPIDEEGDEQSNGDSGQEGGRKQPEEEVSEQRKQHSFSDWMSQEQGEGEGADDAS
ncbi:flagellar hook-length control protein FliK [Shouchella clausii]|uniref:flagellar hook-length control protein FliK n=1 Tax=Shouchella clausii TaxID=79880 RepID=UPI00280C071B|nr:flagellar hook-length control protein FliK [Shouchella clausii]WMM31632.1 flagellar hook-length control protein FliK [Shouchella clausii]